MLSKARYEEKAIGTIFYLFHFSPFFHTFFVKKLKLKNQTQLEQRERLSNLNGSTILHEVLSANGHSTFFGLVGKENASGFGGPSSSWIDPTSIHFAELKPAHDQWITGIGSSGKKLPYFPKELLSEEFCFTAIHAYLRKNPSLSMEKRRQRAIWTKLRGAAMDPLEKEKERLETDRKENERDAKRSKTNQDSRDNSASMDPEGQKAELSETNEDSRDGSVSMDLEEEETKKARRNRLDRERRAAKNLAKRSKTNEDSRDSSTSMDLDREEAELSDTNEDDLKRRPNKSAEDWLKRIQRRFGGEYMKHSGANTNGVKCCRSCGSTADEVIREGWRKGEIYSSEALGMKKHSLDLLSLVFGRN